MRQPTKVLEATRRIEQAAAEMASIADPGLRRQAEATVRQIIELYGAVLEHIITEVQRGPDGARLMQRVASDPLLASLLVVHDLPPLGTPPRERAVPACEVCGGARPDPHRHVVDAVGRSLLCACATCHVVLDRERDGGRYRAVPDRFLQVSAVGPDVTAWQRLQVPVSMAFFLYDSALDRPVGFFPSPAGATESEVSPDAWAELLACDPVAGSLRPDVEALLVRSDAHTTEAFLVPVDVCYQLVGRLRQAWQGPYGGPEVDRLIEECITTVRGRCQIHARSAISPQRAEGPSR